MRRRNSPEVRGYRQVPWSRAQYPAHPHRWAHCAHQMTILTAVAHTGSQPSERCDQPQLTPSLPVKERDALPPNTAPPARQTPAPPAPHLGRALDEAEPPLAGLEAALQLQVEVQLPEQPQRLAAHLRAGRAAAAAPGGADKGNRAPAPRRGAIPQRRGREPRAPGAPRRQGEGARFPSPHGRGWAPPRAPHPGRAARAPAGGRPRSPPRSESRRCPRHRHHPRPRGAAAAAAAAAAPAPHQNGGGAAPPPCFCSAGPQMAPRGALPARPGRRSAARR